MNSYRRTILLFILFFLAVPAFPFSQMDTLKNRINQIVEQASGRVGVAVMNLNNRDTMTVNGSGQFPMQSVFKFPLAVAVLHQVDKGMLALDQQIHLTKSDLLPNTWSPLREKYPDGNIDITLDEIITATVALSDNNGCDILFRLVGGPANVERYLRTLGIDQIAIVATEMEMSKDWNIQYRNWSSPYGMGMLLAKFYRDSILSKKSTEYLWNVLVNTKTGPKRLKGQLPLGSIIGHKTGTSGTNEQGIASATNDAGIMILPDHNAIVVVVFVSDSNATEEIREKIISDIARTVWEAFPVR